MSMNVLKSEGCTVVIMRLTKYMALALNKAKEMAIPSTKNAVLVVDAVVMVTDEIFRCLSLYVILDRIKCY